jgi:hypothetical protein
MATRNAQIITYINIFFIYSASTADIYTCEIDGATTFSQIPCGDSDPKLK